MAKSPNPTSLHSNNRKSAPRRVLMPTTTSEKLSQLRQQLQECSNPAVGKVLKSAIKKLEVHLKSGQVQTKTSKIDQQKSAIREFKKQAKRKAAQQVRTTLKPPSLRRVEPEPEVIFQMDLLTLLAQDSSQEQTEVKAQSGSDVELPQTTADHPKAATLTPKLLDKTESPKKTRNSTRPVKRKLEHDKPIPQTTPEPTKPATPTPKLLDKTELPKKTLPGKREPVYGELREDDRTFRPAPRSIKPDRTSRQAPSEVTQISRPRTPRISAALERRFRNLELSQRDLVDQARVGGELENLAVSKNSAGEYWITVAGTGKPFVRKPFATTKFCWECALELEENFEILQVIELRPGETLERIGEMVGVWLDRERVARVWGKL